MKKRPKQLRRSISLAPVAYEQLKGLAALDGSTLAPVLEKWLAAEAERRGVSVNPDAARARARARVSRLFAQREERAARADELGRGAFGA